MTKTRHMPAIALVAGGLLVTSGCGQKGPVLAGGKPAAHWVESLRSPDASLRRKAVQKLGNIGTTDEAALPAVVQALKDSDATVRKEAMLALLKFGPAARDALPALGEIQQRDPDPEIRVLANKVMQKLPSG